MRSSQNARFIECKWPIHGVQVANEWSAAQEVADSWYVAYKVASPWGEAPWWSIH